MLFSTRFTTEYQADMNLLFKQDGSMSFCCCAPNHNEPTYLVSEEPHKGSSHYKLLTQRNNLSLTSWEMHANYIDTNT